MCEQPNLIWRQFLCLLTLLLAGSSQAVFSQPTLPRATDVFKPGNPPSGYNRNKGTTKPSPVEQAILDGNQARDANDYKKAFASYRQAQEKAPKDPRPVYGLGNVYSDLACSDQAIRAYSEALRLDKNFKRRSMYKETSVALAYLYVTEERYDDAEARFRSVLNKTPHDTSAKIGLAYTTAKRQQYDQAIEQFHRIIDDASIKNQERALAYLYLGDLYLEQKKWEDAAGNFRKAIEQDQGLAAAYMKLGQAILLPEMWKFNLLVPQERSRGDHERIAKAAKNASEFIRKAVNEHGYDHPLGNLLLAYALVNQFDYPDAEANAKEYERKVRQLEADSASLAASCGQGLKQLYAYGPLVLALIYTQRSLLEKDEVKSKQYAAQVIEYGQQVITVKGDIREVYLFMGVAYFRLGKWTEAVEQLETALVRETNEETKSFTLSFIGLCHEKLGHNEEAARAYNEAFKLRPNSVTALLSVSSIHDKNGNFDEAIRLKKQAIERAPEHTAALSFSLATSYFLKANQQKSDSDYEEAISLLKKSLEMSPSFGPAYLMLGNAYKFYKNGKYADDSLANYQQAEKYDPNNPTIKYQMGNLFYAVMKNYPAAINYLEAAIKLRPDYAEAHWQLGLVHHAKGDSNEAIKHLKSALDLNDRYLRGYLDLADIYVQQNSYDEAIKLWSTAADKLPLEYLPYKELARLYSHQQKTDEAIKSYEEAIARMKPDQWLRDFYRCRIVRLRAQYPEAITCVQNIKLPSNGDPAQIPYEIGLTHLASKNKAAALVQYEQLKKMNPSLAEDLLTAINQMK